MLTADDNRQSNMLLKGTVICASSMDRELKQEIRTMVEELGGTYSQGLNVQVNYLLADTVRSEKYRMAAKLSIPIVRTAWIRLCFSHRNDERFDPLKHIAEYELLPFAGLRVAVTNFQPSEVQTIKELVLQNGGDFSGQLTSTCTHLIAACAGSRKHDAAIKWKLNIVNAQWLHDSIAMNACADEILYPIEVKDPNAKVDSTSLALLEDDDSTSQDCALLYLDRCNIYPGEGFSDQQLQQIKKMIRAGGGSMPKAFDGFVTHYLVPGRTASEGDIRMIRTSARFIPVISYQWLRDCYRERMPLPTDSYMIDVGEDPFEASTARRTRCISEQRDITGLNADTVKPKSRLRDAQKRSRSSFQMEDVFADPLETSSMAHRVLTKAREAPNGDESAVIANQAPLEGRGKGSLSTSHPTAISSPRYTSRPNLECNISNQSLAASGIHCERPGSQAYNGVFSGIRFSCSGFGSEEREMLRQLVEGQGGSFIVSLPESTDDHIVIVPLLGSTGKVGLRSRLVTEFWLERCIEDGLLHDMKANILFTPLRQDMPLPGFNRYVIGVSGYEGVERAHLGKLTTIMGATFTETFSKQNTHLLCKPGTDNAKYRRAKDWRIPIVDADWLYTCAAAGYVVHPLEGESVGNTVDVTRRPKASDLFDRNTAFEDKVSDLDEESEFPATGAFQPRFETNAVLSSLITPKAQLRDIGRNVMSGSPLEVSFTKNLEKAVRQANGPRQGSVGQIHSIDSSGSCVEQKNAAPPPTLLQGVIICLSPRVVHRRSALYPIATRMGAEMLVAYSDTCTHYMHQGNRVNEAFRDFKIARQRGKYIVSPSWLVACHETGQRVKELDYPHTYNPHRALSISTPTSSQRMSDTVEDQHPNETSASSSPQEKLERDDVKEDARQHQQSPHADDSRDDQCDVGDDQSAPLPGVEKYVEIIDRLLDAKMTRRRPRHSVLRRDVTVSSIFSDDIPTEDSTKEVGRVDVHPFTQTQIANRQQEEAAVIVYDDPDSRVEKRKLLEQIETNGKRPKLSNNEDPSTELEGNGTTTLTDTGIMPQQLKNVHEVNELLRRNSSFTGSTLDANGFTTESEAPIPPNRTVSVCSSGIKEPSYARTTSMGISSVSERTISVPTTVTPPSMRKSSRMSISTRVLEPAARKFLLSGLPREERVRMSQLISRLGGTVLEYDCWHPDCTHLIVSKPARTEKPLAAIAAGAWVLRPTYIEACKTAARFLDEVDYEWVPDPDTPPIDRNVFSAPRRWRLKLQNAEMVNGIRKGSFTGWKVLLLVDNRKKDGFTRLLNAGGAKVVANPKTFRGVNTEDLTYVITDQEPSTLRKQAVLMRLASRSIPFVDPNYCGEYLFGEPPPSPSRWQINILGNES
ncbi:uncharacterized protein SPPG_03760 [Spizellomyces punctatus DAOM BR117]|uniref:BRCT domain-containing protein n=1 Tax=Spizellomyces punctatus (strain DAOM BR117) TaxID=645134 RepID=A0A0L0HHS5_SPIPD|nr:uncharacterized protein SPPG_03760 [Spizellomyces punctatus DAOM BR117]KND00633.1 hypothetical protein SPPG_03760 [Spizellomyces punctatus DAOM BR117]|eukprot:XP_016608672.1 hypothetical protein SPPG_03760 [Spizellomyces punctatus DAOM BR117]